MDEVLVVLGVSLLLCCVVLCVSFCVLCVYLRSPYLSLLPSFCFFGPLTLSAPPNAKMGELCL